MTDDAGQQTCAANADCAGKDDVCGRCIDAATTGFENSKTKVPYTCVDLAGAGYCSDAKHGVRIKKSCPFSCGTGERCCTSADLVDDDGPLEQTCAADVDCDSADEVCGTCADSVETTGFTDEETQTPQTCVQLAVSGHCLHAEHGAQIRDACPSSCTTGKRCCKQAGLDDADGDDPYQRTCAIDADCSGSDVCDTCVDGAKCGTIAKVLGVCFDAEIGSLFHKECPLTCNPHWAAETKCCGPTKSARACGSNSGATLDSDGNCACLPNSKGCSGTSCLQTNSSDGGSTAFYWLPESDCDDDTGCLHMCDLVIDPPQTAGDAICTVTTAADSDDMFMNSPGNVTLRRCIEELNAAQLVAEEGSRARIHFNIRSADGADAGRAIIKLNAALPNVMKTVTIDGTTQPYPSDGGGTALAWTPAVVLDGTNAKRVKLDDNGNKVRALAVNGIQVGAPDVVIKGLTVQQFSGEGFISFGARTRMVGMHVRGNGGHGIYVHESAVGSVIGDSTTGGSQGRVVVVDHPNDGIVIAAPNTRIANVYVGVEADGKTANENDSGINVKEPAVGFRIGDANAGVDGLVVVSGSGTYGIHSFASNGTIVNTYVGVAADGTTAVPNFADGIFFGEISTHTSVGVPSTDPGNTINQQHSRVVVSGNGRDGISVRAAHTTLGRVYIGVAADGVTPVPNRARGIFLNAPTTATSNSTIKIGPGAIISGNHDSGILVQMRIFSPTTIIIDGCLIGLVDPSGTAFNTALAEGINPNSISTQLAAVGNFESGVKVELAVGDVYPITITRTLIGGNLLHGINPPTSTTANHLDNTSTIYPNTTPLLGNDRADHVCQRCRCAPITSSAVNPTSFANTRINNPPPPSWKIDCKQMCADSQNAFGDRLPIGFLDGGDTDHANTVGPLTNLRMAGAGLTSLPWSTELTANITTEFELLDLSDNPNLNPLPTTTRTGPTNAYNKTVNHFSKEAFSKLASLFLQGSDLSGFTNTTLTALSSTLSALDLSRPSIPPNADVEFNFTGFDRLTAVIWFNNSKCPRGFFATAASTSRDDAGVCSRCTVDTFQPYVGMVGIDACIACPEGTVDADKDPTTPCTLPAPIVLTADPNLSLEQGYLKVFTDGFTYEFDGPKLAKSKLFKGFTGPAGKIVYAMKVVRSTATNSTVVRRAELDETVASDDPAGRFFVDDKGNVLAKMTTVGKYTGELSARDSVGAEVSVHTWEFEVKRPIEESSTSGKGGSIAATVLGSILAVAIVALVVLRYRAEQLEMRAHNFDAELQAFLESKTPAERMQAMTTSDGLAKVPREIKRKCVTRTDKIGEGQFGEVFKGILDESSTGGVPGYLVACKSVVDGSGEGANDLLQEALVMAQVGPHQNLVSLIGVVTSGSPLLLVVSYCERGSLLSVLRDRAEMGDALSTVTKLRFAVNIASGMAHLASVHFIHRDLAARNVLVDAQFSCRVADFGLSRGMAVNADGGQGGEGGGGHYYRSQNGIFPVRWTAPEAMSDLKFTTHSDVWSFGVVMAELFQDGLQPYASVETEAVIRLVCQGDRMAQPAGCPAAVYAVMQACWRADSASRPAFLDLVPTLEAQLDVEQNRGGNSAGGNGGGNGEGCTSGVSAAAAPHNPSAAGYSGYASPSPSPDADEGKAVVVNPLSRPRGASNVGSNAYTSMLTSVPAQLAARPGCAVYNSPPAARASPGGGGAAAPNDTTTEYSLAAQGAPIITAGITTTSLSSGQDMYASQLQAPSQPGAAGDEFRTRAPSVYLGFSAGSETGEDNDETRL